MSATLGRVCITGRCAMAWFSVPSLFQSGRPAALSAASLRKSAKAFKRVATRMERLPPG